MQKEAIALAESLGTSAEKLAEMTSRLDGYERSSER